MVQLIQIAVLNNYFGAKSILQSSSWRLKQFMFYSPFLHFVLLKWVWLFCCSGWGLLGLCDISCSTNAVHTVCLLSELQKCCAAIRLGWSLCGLLRARANEAPGTEHLPRVPSKGSSSKNMTEKQRCWLALHRTAVAASALTPFCLSRIIIPTHGRDSLSLNSLAASSFRLLLVLTISLLF